MLMNDTQMTIKNGTSGSNQEQPTNPSVNTTGNASAPAADGVNGSNQSLTSAVQVAGSGGPAGGQDSSKAQNTTQQGVSAAGQGGQASTSGKAAPSPGSTPPPSGSATSPTGKASTGAGGQSSGGFLSIIGNIFNSPILKQILPYMLIGGLFGGGIGGATGGFRMNSILGGLLLGSLLGGLGGYFFKPFLAQSQTTTQQANQNTAAQASNA